MAVFLRESQLNKDKGVVLREPVQGVLQLQLHPSFLLAMCLDSITIKTSNRSLHSVPQSFQSPLPTISTNTVLDLRGGLWNRQLVVKKTETILAYTAFQSLHFMALTETSQRPGSSRNTLPLQPPSPPTLSPTPPDPLGEAGERDSSSLQSGHTRSVPWNTWPDLHLNSMLSFTLPINLNIAVIYRPPGSLGDFSTMDALLSCWRWHPTCHSGWLHHPGGEVTTT